MIKFRCPNCGQKIAVNDEGIGAVISCTTCMENIIVPPDTETEFEAPTVTEPVNSDVAPCMQLLVPAQTREERWQERALQAEARFDKAFVALRSGLIPHLARLMVNKLVQVLIAQRADLLDTQQAATVRILQLEQRLEKAHENLQSRLLAYEVKVSDLQRQLASKEEENRRLQRTNLQIARRALQSDVTPHKGRVDLRDAGFLLRA